MITSPSRKVPVNPSPIKLIKTNAHKGFASVIWTELKEDFLAEIYFF